MVIVDEDVINFRKCKNTHFSDENFTRINNLTLTLISLSGDITAPGGDILSKGKELIFMKFGLGGK